MSSLLEEKSAYTIKTGTFEGPFGLLLSLVEDRKLFINDVSLAQVTEDYLKYINNLPKEEKEEIASFILVAATLILIKSKSLLPDLSLSAEEETDIRNLEDRLKLYELYNNLAVHIKDNFGKKIIFPSEERKIAVKIFLPDSQITKESMLELASSLLNKLPGKAKLGEVEVKKVISIEEMIDKLTDRIQSTLKFNFREFSGGTKTKEEKVFVIVGFLAMLEMIRTGILEAVQENSFSDIIIEKQINNHEISE
ncbi:MAG: segregation/condensation protein A [Candidatus Pacebacteria bacterium]|nr:segregation/condensation protein A [Candidatus Paceibacterota bacterium]MBP9851253.1 segregation/condensation protein A [Candidatus Paceibacterota bacterium]